MRPHRVAALCLLVCSPSLVRAADVPRATPPPDVVYVEEPHRFSPILEGTLGAIAGVAILSGVAVISDSYRKFEDDRLGGSGTSCRPCTDSQIEPARAELYASFALFAVGGVLAITTGVLVGLDSRYRSEHRGAQVSRVQLTPTGLRF